MTAVNAQLKARDIMVAEPICVEPSTTIRQLARILEENEISGAPVINHLGVLIGVVSKTDLLRRCSEGVEGVPASSLLEVLAEEDQLEDEEESDASPEAQVCVQDFMTEDPITVSPETPVSAVAHRMFQSRIHRVIVVDREKIPVGIITSLDLLGAFP